MKFIIISSMVLFVVYNIYTFKKELDVNVSKCHAKGGMFVDIAFNDKYKGNTCVKLEVIE